MDLRLRTHDHRSSRPAAQADRYASKPANQAVALIGRSPGDSSTYLFFR